jgi:hypothetical protein
MVAGKLSPLMLNPLPDTVAPVTVRFVLPVFVNCTACVLLWPTVTFPNAIVDGESESPACVPVPLSPTNSGEFDASLVTVIVPVTDPVACGANWI